MRHRIDTCDLRSRQEFYSHVNPLLSFLGLADSEIWSQARLTLRRLNASIKPLNWSKPLSNLKFKFWSAWRSLSVWERSWPIWIRSRIQIGASLLVVTKRFAPTTKLWGWLLLPSSIQKTVQTVSHSYLFVSIHWKMVNNETHTTRPSTRERTKSA